jgi:hypothetical protein
MKYTYCVTYNTTYEIGQTMQFANWMISIVVQYHYFS